MNMPGFQNPRSERDGVRDRLADARGSTWRTSAHSELLAWVWWLATIAWVCISEGGGGDIQAPAVTSAGIVSFELPA